jgi:hypothetical protein
MNMISSNDKICSKSEWSHSSDFIYHYTSNASAQSILRENKIRTTAARVRRFGTGVFMTVMSPTESDNVLLENNYQGNPQLHMSKLEVAFAVRKTAIDAKRIIDPRDSARDLWRHDYEIDLRNVDYFMINRN